MDDDFWEGVAEFYTAKLTAEAWEEATIHMAKFRYENPEVCAKMGEGLLEGMKLNFVLGYLTHAKKKFVKKDEDD